MYGSAQACYIRLLFTVTDEDIAGANHMSLRVRYDDGFVAYLNGTRIASANAALAPAWDAGATASHSDTLATAFEAFDCSEAIGLLQSGHNILAIHGMNRGNTSSDFLISAELVAGEDMREQGVSLSAIPYYGPVTLKESALIKARILDHGQWSACHEAFFSVGLEQLRITELMYHPLTPGTEFIELQNIGTEPIELNQVRFTQGVDFTFPALLLAPQARVLVVQNQAAFAARYDISTLRIAGQYSGKLDNGGEQIELQDAIGGVLFRFEYQDGWYDVTDGQGYSLSVKDPINTAVADWGQKATWQPSELPGGSPGHE
jgi:hypothetical protein